MKNTIEEIQAKISRVEAMLEPERLFWDGERDRSEALQAGEVLTKELASLRARLAAEMKLAQ